METKKTEIMMFYPISWGRHAFDEYSHGETEKIVGKIKELQTEHADDVQTDVTFMPWEELTEDFITSHWCVAVDEAVKNAIEN